MPTIRGERESCFAQTEPEAGSDPGAMRTTAVRDGDHYVINGTKRFITGADRADFVILMAATDRSKGSRGGISCFVLDMDTPGVKLTTRYRDADRRDARGRSSSTTCACTNEPSGRRGRRRLQPRAEMARRRPHQAGRARARRDPALPRIGGDLRQAAHAPSASRSPSRQAIQWRLVDTYVALEAATLLVHHAAARIDRGEDDRNDAYLVKLFCTEMAWQAADMCLQVHGGIGLTTDLPVERLWRDQRSHMITEGTPEIMRMALARHVLNTFGQ